MGCGVHFTDRAAPGPEQHPGRPAGCLCPAGLPVGDLTRVPQDSSDLARRSRSECPEDRRPAGAFTGVTHPDSYMGRKIASEDAARVLEIIGRPDAAALIMNADWGHGT